MARSRLILNSVRLLTVSCAVVAFPTQPVRSPPQAAELPRLAIGSRDDVLTALSAQDEDSELRTVLLAVEGRRISPWLREILRDEAVSFEPKVQALAVLRYTRDSLLVDDLILLMAAGPEILQVRAREALVFFPYAGVCAVWRRMISAPNTPDGALFSAIAGLGYCGSDADAALLDVVRRTAQYRSQRDLAVTAINRVRLPRDERFHPDIWAMSDSLNGDLVPGAALAMTVQRRVCGGPCNRPIRLSPGERLHDRGR